MKKVKNGEWHIGLPKDVNEKFTDLFSRYLNQNNVKSWVTRAKTPVGKRMTVIYTFDIDKHMRTWIDHSLEQAFAGLPDDLYITIERKEHELWTR